MGNYKIYILPLWWYSAYVLSNNRMYCCTADTVGLWFTAYWVTTLFFNSWCEWKLQAYLSKMCCLEFVRATTVRQFPWIGGVINCSMCFKVLWRHAIKWLAVFFKTKSLFAFDPFYIITHIGSFDEFAPDLYSTREWISVQLKLNTHGFGISGQVCVSWV